MAELLEALGWRMRLADCVRLIALIGAVTTTILVAGLALAAATPVSIFIVQAGIWAAWLLWLGIVFPRNGRRDAKSPVTHPYRRAFRREILLGNLGRLQPVLGADRRRGRPPRNPPPPRPEPWPSASRCWRPASR